MENFDLQGLLDNPLLQMGMGILGANTGQISGGSAIGRGVMSGMQNYREQQQQALLNRMYQMKLDEAKKKQEQDDETNALFGTYGKDNDTLTSTQTTPGGYENAQAYSNAPNYTMNKLPDVITQKSTSFFNPDKFNAQAAQLGGLSVDDRIKLLKPRDFIKAAPGDVFINPQSGQPQFSVPALPKNEWSPNGKIVDMNNPDLNIDYSKPLPSNLESDVRGYLAANGIDPDTATLEQQKDAYTIVNKQKDKRAPRTLINVNKDLTKALSQPIGDRADASRTTAEGAVETMTTTNSVREALNKGSVIAGPLAGPRLKWAQIKSLAGAGDTQQLEATRVTIQGLASMTLEARSALKGSGAITEGETKLLERARSGSIDEMTVNELHTVVDVAQRLSGRQWAKHQELLKIMEKDPAAESTYRYYVPLGEMPAPTAQTAKKLPVPSPYAITTLKLKKNMEEFDQEFGPGAAKRALGE